ncbi:hypothetical protein JCM10213v2_008297 [Rhodosporidiobolus nylandii]
MYGNYLGLNTKRGGAGGPGGSRYGRQPPASASTRCQKCNQLGHWTSDCKNPREYKVRPTRTQILKNPKLRTPLTESVMARTEEMPKEGTAAAILAANEAKRAAKAKALKEKEEESRGRSRRRGSSQRLAQQEPEQVEVEELQPFALPRPARAGPLRLPLPLAFSHTHSLASSEAPRPVVLAQRLAVEVADEVEVAQPGREAGEAGLEEREPWQEQEQECD